MCKKLIYLFSLVLVFSLARGLVSTAQAEPRYVIFLIGDGMGFEQVKAGGMYVNGQAGAHTLEITKREDGKWLDEQEVQIRCEIYTLVSHR